MNVVTGSFRCWYCGREQEARQFHHAVRVREPHEQVRRCCLDCYRRPDSNYRRVYEDEEQELDELARQGRIG